MSISFEVPQNSKPSDLKSNSHITTNKTELNWLMKWLWRMSSFNVQTHRNYQSDLSLPQNILESILTIFI